MRSGSKELSRVLNMAESPLGYFFKSFLWVIVQHSTLFLSSTETAFFSLLLFHGNNVGLKHMRKNQTRRKLPPFTMR